MADQKRIEELIEKGSFGTKGAKDLSARTPQHIVDKIVKAVTEDKK